MRRCPATIMLRGLLVSLLAVFAPFGPAQASDAASVTLPARLVPAQPENGSSSSGPESAVRAKPEYRLRTKQSDERDIALDIPAGAASFRFDGWDGPPIDVFTQRPERLSAGTEIIIVLHGMNRNADDYRDDWRAIADACDVVVLVPRFDDRRFPGAAGYNLGEAIPGHPGVSAFDVIEPLFDRARVGLELETRGYGLFGHSAGAQFVHRFLMLTPDTRAVRAVAANAGWYTWPDMLADWPYGLRNAPRPPLTQGDIAAQNLTLLLGDADRDPQAPNLRRSPEAMEQGESRFRRGIRTAALVDYIAARLGQGSGWNLATVPDVGHDHAAMTPPSVRHLLPADHYNRPACQRARQGG